MGIILTDADADANGESLRLAVINLYLLETQHVEVRAVLLVGKRGIVVSPRIF